MDCEKCGTQNEETMNLDEFCEDTESCNCGCTAGEAEAAEPAKEIAEPAEETAEPAEEAAEPTEEKAEKPAKPAKKKPKFLVTALVVCGALLLVAAVALFFIFGVGSPQKALEQYVRATAEMDLVDTLDCCILSYQDYYNATRDAMGLSDQEFKGLLAGQGYDSFEDALNEMADEQRKLFREYYGEDYIISIEVLDMRTLTREETADFLANYTLGLNYAMGLNLADLINVDKISEIREFEVDQRIAGSKGSDSYVDTMYMAKIGFKWLVFLNLGF
ncbi:MAG: hypothetical protein FWF10_04825 [Clostridiales bacterium]|nr:hypothetical protein [Clostridiales bacterium]